MGSLEKRLKTLENHPGRGKPFAENYPDLVSQVRAEAEVATEMGTEPDFYVDEAGLVRAALDSRVIHHVGEQMLAMGEVPGIKGNAEDLESSPEWYEEYQRRVNERLNQWGESGLRPKEGT